MRKVFTVLLCLCYMSTTWAQTYSIVIKEGRVIDPKNNIDAIMDVAIQAGKIALVAKNIDASKATQVVNAKGLVVTPGLIDMHTHNFVEQISIRHI